MTNELLEAALAYVARGWAVIPLCSPRPGGCNYPKHAKDGKPCHSPGKRPIISDWVEGALRDPDAVRATWECWPDSNIGMVGGSKSGVDVLDSDPRNATNPALPTWAELEERHGRIPALRARSGGADGGEHVFLVHRPDVELRVPCQGMDVIGEGRQVVLPPSLHRSGRRYEWLPGPQAPAAVPPWVDTEAETYARQTAGQQGGKGRRSKGKKGPAAGAGAGANPGGPTPLSVRAASVARALHLRFKLVGSVAKILDPCPACRAEHEPGTAWLLPSGTLRCVRTKCEANVEAGGLALADWVGRFAPEALEALSPVALVRERVVIEASRALLPETTRDEADRRMDGLFDAAFEAARAGVARPLSTLQLDTGAGKTRAFVRAAVRNVHKGHYAIYAAESGPELDEVGAQLLAAGVPHVYYVARDRDRYDRDGRRICSCPRPAAPLPAPRSFVPRPGRPGRHRRACPLSARYYREPDVPELPGAGLVVLVAHAALATALADWGKSNPLVVCDEQPQLTVTNTSHPRGRKDDPEVGKQVVTAAAQALGDTPVAILMSATPVLSLLGAVRARGPHARAGVQHIRIRTPHRHARTRVVVASTSVTRRKVHRSASARLAHALQHVLRPDRRRLLVVVYKFVENGGELDRVLEAWKAAAAGRTYVVAHYGAVRGVNRYGDCDAVVTLGDPWINERAHHAEVEFLGLSRLEQEIYEENVRAALAQAHGRAGRLVDCDHVHVGEVVPAGWADAEVLGVTRGRPCKVDFSRTKPPCDRPTRPAVASTRPASGTTDRAPERDHAKAALSLDHKCLIRRARGPIYAAAPRAARGAGDPPPRIAGFAPAFRPPMHTAGSNDPQVASVDDPGWDDAPNPDWVRPDWWAPWWAPLPRLWRRG